MISEELFTEQHGFIEWFPLQNDKSYTIYNIKSTMKNTQNTHYY